MENLSNKLFCLIYGVFVCLMFRTNILDLLVIFLTTSPHHPFPAKFPDPSPLDQDKTGLFYEINFLCHFLTPSIANTTSCGWSCADQFLALFLPPPSPAKFLDVSKSHISPLSTKYIEKSKGKLKIPADNSVNKLQKILTHSCYWQIGRGGGQHPASPEPLDQLWTNYGPPWLTV